MSIGASFDCVSNQCFRTTNTTLLVNSYTLKFPQISSNHNDFIFSEAQNAILKLIRASQSKALPPSHKKSSG